FSSHDYLGFSRLFPLKIELKKWGSTGSRLLTGNSQEIEELEAYIASFHGAETGLIFNSGYTANLGLLASVVMPDDVVIYDAHCHASTQDGMRLSKAQLYPFWHQDLNHLEKRLRNARKRTFVCIETVYSCDGSIAPLKEIATLC